MYTMYLIEELDILGKNCQAKEKGYNTRIIEQTVDFLSNSYSDFKEITPRVAIKVADTMNEYPDVWETILDNQNIYENE